MASLQRVALITGGSRGIGAGIVRRLAADGVRVAFTYVQSKQQAHDLADEAGALPIQADSGDPDAVRSAVERTVRELGGLDILVNNSFVGDVYPLAEFPLDRFDRMIDVNIRGAWIAIQAADPHLREGGRIINMGSVFAERQPPGTTPGLAVYNLTKSALDAMARGLARELGPRGITVNTIQPGAIKTDALNDVMAERMAGYAAVGRVGEPVDIANAVAYLASPEAWFVTGVAWTVDGGFAA